MRAKENYEIIIERHPHYQSLNEKILEYASTVKFEKRFDKIGAAMTDLRIPPNPSVTLIKNWVEQLVVRKWKYATNVWAADLSDTWMVKYRIGDQSFSHDHRMSLLSFVYFVHSPKGSSPLVFTTSGKKVKPEEGRVAIFPANVLHHVPKNRGEGRLVLAGNLEFRFK